MSDLEWERSRDPEGFQRKCFEWIESHDVNIVSNLETYKGGHHRWGVHVWVDGTWHPFYANSLEIAIQHAMAVAP
jgi:hypothetical protein